MNSFSVSLGIFDDEELSRGSWIANQNKWCVVCVELCRATRSTDYDTNWLHPDNY